VGVAWATKPASYIGSNTRISQRGDKCTGKFFAPHGMSCVFGVGGSLSDLFSKANWRHGAGMARLLDLGSSNWISGGDQSVRVSRNFC
jgi:hypothetical protein